MISALDSDSIGALSVGVIVALVVIGLVLTLVVSALIARLLIVVLVVALCVFVYHQRTTIENHVKDCNRNMSFVGLHVDLPRSVAQKCRAAHRLSG